MRLYDERKLWCSEVEDLAEKLSDKSKREVQLILDWHDVIALRSCDRPKTTFLGRLLFPLIAIILLLSMPLKWLITGNSYFDSVAKKNKWIRSITDYVGIK